MNAGSLSRSSAQSSSANSRIRRRSPLRPAGADHRIHSMRATGASGGGGGGIYAARSLHSGAGWPVRRITGRSEEAFQQSDAAGRSTNWCSGARHAGPPGAHGRISTVSSGAGMRNDSMRIRPDQIRFDQMRFDSAKFGHRVSLGKNSVVVWTTNATRRLALNGGSSATRTASRIQAASAKSTASYVAAPEDREGGGGASARSSTGHASVTSGGEEDERPHLQASAAAVADKPSESSVVVVMEKKRSREKSSVVVISNSDSMVRFHPSPGNLRLIDPAPATVHASSTTVPTDAGHGLLAPLQVYGRVCRNEAASKGTQEAAGGSFRQICSSASYTVVLDRLQRERASEHHAESRAAAVSRKSHESLSSNSKPVIAATNMSEAVNLKSERVASNHRNISRNVKSSTGNKERSTSCVDDVATELKRKTSEPERAREAATAGRKRSVKYDVGESLEDNATSCEPCSSSASSHSPRERTEFQKEKTVTDFMDEEAANESGAAMKVRFAKSVNVNETLAVDHFRQRLDEERTRTTTLRRKLGVIRKDLTKSRTELIREEELRARSEQWAEYLERELESYVRSRAEAEKRYLNLLQVVRGIDRFTKQLLHKYVALHRKVEVGFEKLATSLPQQILPIPKPHDSPPPPPPAATAASASVRDQKDVRPTDMRAAADVAPETRDEGPPPSTEDDIQLDLLPDDDYDFITKYLRASASLPEAIADVDSAGLYPEADECDTEANWSSNNFVSFCGEASRSFDETGRRDEQCRNVRLLKSEDVVAANDGRSGECAAGAKKKRSKAHDVRLKRLGRFFDRVVRICRQKPEANFRLLADKSCLLADEIRLSIDERKRRDTRSKRRQGPWQNGGFVTKDFVFQVRSHGAGDITEEAHFDMENISRCHEHLPSELEDEVDWEDDEDEEDEEEEEDTEEEEDVEDIFEEEEELLVDVIGVKKQNANKRHEKKLEEKTREGKKREDKELDEKQREYKRLEEQRQEKKREEKRLEEQKQEAKKLFEKTREEKRLEEQKRVEKKLEERTGEQKRIEEQEREERKLLEKTREEKRLEEQKRVEKKLEEKKREEVMLEKQKVEEKKLENKRREEKKLEEQKRVERKLEEKKEEEERLERQKRQKLEEKKLDDIYREEKKIRERKREERKQEEKKREEQNREGKKRDEKHDGSKPKSPSSNQCDAALAAPTTAKKSPPNHKAQDDRQSETETKSKVRPGGAGGREGVAIPSSVQQAYIRRLLTEMCHYCDRYRPGDSTDGLKVFLRDTIEADFLQSTDAGASHSRNVDQ